MQIIAPAVQYIALHYMENISIQELGRLCHVSTTHLRPCVSARDEMFTPGVPSNGTAGGGVYIAVSIGSVRFGSRQSGGISYGY